MSFVKKTWKNVVGFSTRSAFPSTGSTDLYYHADDTGTLYKWNGSTYIISTDDVPRLNAENLNRIENALDGTISFTIIS